SGDLNAGGVSVSDDGRYVAFISQATNLGFSDNNGSVADVFVYDRMANTIERFGGNQAALATPVLSGDGHYLAWVSKATDLVSNDTNGFADLFVEDRITHAVMRVQGAASPNGDSWEPDITPDGRYVSFASDAKNLVTGDTNGKSDIFVFDTVTHAI